MPENATPEAEGAPKAASTGLLSGTKGWIVVIGALVFEALFFTGIILYRDSKPPELPDPDAIPLKDLISLNWTVPINSMVNTIEGPAGDAKPLQYDLEIVLDYLPSELATGALKPKPGDFDVFKELVTRLEPSLRSHMNGFMTRQRFQTLQGARGQEMVRNEVMQFLNAEMEKYDLSKRGVNAKLSRRRVTDVRIPKWNWG